MHVFTRGWPQAMTRLETVGERNRPPPGGGPGGEYLNAFRNRKDLATVQSSRFGLTWCLIQSMMRSRDLEVVVVLHEHVTVARSDSRELGQMDVGMSPPPAWIAAISSGHGDTGRACGTGGLPVV